MTEYAVNAPIGAAGNHVRWLMLLDPKFSTSLTTVDNEIRESMPPFIDLKSLDNHIICPFNDIKNKFKFIENYVYFNKRSWNNWLTVEWRYRKNLNLCIQFDHDYKNILPLPTKTVALIVDPAVAYKHYLKFNSNLNFFSKDLFYRIIDNNNYHVNRLKSELDILVIDSNLLFTSKLNLDIYHSIIKFFNFSDQYELAQKVHTLWFDLHKKSEIELLNEFQKLYGQGN